MTDETPFMEDRCKENAIRINAEKAEEWLFAQSDLKDKVVFFQGVKIEAFSKHALQRMIVMLQAMYDRQDSRRQADRNMMKLFMRPNNE